MPAVLTAIEAYAAMTAALEAAYRPDEHLWKLSSKQTSIAVVDSRRHQLFEIQRAPEGWMVTSEADGEPQRTLIEGWSVERVFALLDGACAPPVPKGKGKNEAGTRDAARLLRLLLERQLVPQRPSWTVQSTPRGLGVDVREGDRPVALVWWDQDGWWCRRFPTPADPEKAKGIAPIHDMDEWTIASMSKWIVDNDPAC